MRRSRPRSCAAAALAVLLGLSAAPGAVAATALVDAARQGDRAAAVELLGGGAEVDAASPDGTTALHWAVFHEDAELVNRLLEAGADANRANRFGATPMSEAAVAGNVAILRALLDAGADVESRNRDGQTALMLVARSSNVEAARLLLSRGADVDAVEGWRGQTALMWAAAQNQGDMVRLLVESGADVDARSKVNRWERLVNAEPRAHYRPPGGWTALLYAARHGCLACAAALADGGADVDLADPEGVTALLTAIVNWHFDLAKYLLERGADPNKWDIRGRTPLFAAVDMNTLPEGGWPDRPPTDTTTSLELVRLLLEAGANPNARLKLHPGYRSYEHDRGQQLLMTVGATSLLRAAQALDLPVVRMLLEHGADPNLPIIVGVTESQIVGITPLMAVAGLGTRRGPERGGSPSETTAIEAARLLLAGGAAVDARDSHGRTALHGAAAAGWTDLARFLLEQGADVSAADAAGVTPLEAALGKMEEGRLFGGAGAVHEETAAYLAERMASQVPGPD